jgi:hypothetical protein
MPVLDIQPLAATCAPAGAPTLMLAIAKTEGGFDSYPHQRAFSDAPISQDLGAPGALAQPIGPAVQRTISHHRGLV